MVHGRGFGGYPSALRYFTSSVHVFVVAQAPLERVCRSPLASASCGRGCCARLYVRV